MRCGQLCTDCGKGCKDDSGVSIECPSCSGKGCDKCGDEGTIELDRCPWDIIGNMSTFTKLATLYHRGVMPVVGGSLDQSAQFVNAAEFLNDTERRIVNKNG